MTRRLLQHIHRPLHWTKHPGTPVQSPTPICIHVHASFAVSGGTRGPPPRLQTAHCLSFPTDQSIVACPKPCPQRVTVGPHAPHSPAHMRPTSRRASSCLVLSRSLCAARAFMAICRRSHAVGSNPTAHSLGMGCQGGQHASACCWERHAAWQQQSTLTLPARSACLQLPLPQNKQSGGSQVRHGLKLCVTECNIAAWAAHNLIGALHSACRACPSIRPGSRQPGEPTQPALLAQRQQRSLQPLGLLPTRLQRRWLLLLGLQAPAP